MTLELYLKRSGSLQFEVWSSNYKFEHIFNEDILVIHSSVWGKSGLICMTLEIYLKRSGSLQFEVSSTDIILVQMYMYGKKCMGLVRDKTEK